MNLITRDEYIEAELEALERYVHARIDYPKMNCRQCLRLKRQDGVTPKCEKGDGCPIPKPSDENQLAYSVYSALSRSFFRDYPSAIELIFKAFDLTLTRQELDLFLDRLCLIHEVVNRGK